MKPQGRVRKEHEMHPYCCNYYYCVSDLPADPLSELPPSSIRDQLGVDFPLDPPSAATSRLSAGNGECRLPTNLANQCTRMKSVLMNRSVQRMNLVFPMGGFVFKGGRCLLLRHGLLPPVSRASRSITGTRQVAGRAAIVRRAPQRQGRGQAVAFTAWRHPDL